MPRSNYSLVLSALLSVAATGAAASPVVYSFSATVTQSKGGPGKGTILPVTITLDDAYPADANSADPRHQATYSGGSASASRTSPILSASIGNISFHGWYDVVHIEKNLAGVSEVLIQSTVPQYGLSFTMTMTTTMKGVVHSVAIPRTLFPANFQSSTVSVYVAPTDNFVGRVK